MIPESTIMDNAIGDALLRAGKPVFVRRVAESLATSGILTDETLCNARSSKDAVCLIAELTEVLQERLARETGTRIALFARAMMPVFAEQTDTATWPDGWWQAFRSRWLPTWWLRRHPTKWRNKSIRASINMSEIVKACIKAPTDGKPTDSLMVVPEVEFDRWDG